MVNRNYFMTCLKQNSKKLIIVSLGVLFFDQTIKFAVVDKIIEIDFYKNYNFLFGITFNYGLYITAIAIAIIVLSIFFAKRDILKKQDTAIYIFLGSMLGGIISNVSDRFFRGYIVDYIMFINIFSFNLADIAIVFGASAIFLKIMKK